VIGARYDAVVIGGGAVGCSVALYLRGLYDRVLLLEREPALLRRASYSNQARVHNGYHYPRSFITALRSRVNFPRFAEEFADCVVRDFDKLYAIPRQYSKVTAPQFAMFCRRIGAPIEPATREARRLFDPGTIEDVFLVQEYAFDADKLQARLASSLVERDVEVRLGANASRAAATPGGDIALEIETSGATETVHAGHVYNCTYSQINALLRASGLSLIPLKHEATEMALVEVPQELLGVGITIMCGPFFSLMPFPARALHSLSHVRFTPHFSWQEPQSAPRAIGERPERSNFDRMVRDAQRFVPSARECRYVDSLWETKTVLPSSEADDSRPILFKRDAVLPNLISIMGGKIDNIYDVFAELDALGAASAGVAG